MLALYGKTALAQDAHLPNEGTGFGGITLAYNVRQREEVNTVLAEAQAAGATILKSAAETDWGGYTGYCADPDGYPWEVAWNHIFRCSTMAVYTCHAKQRPRYPASDNRPLGSSQEKMSGLSFGVHSQL